MIRICGAALGFLAFAVAILLGLLANNSVETTLIRAMWAMVVFCIIGFGVGWVAKRVIEEHSTRLQRDLFARLNALLNQQAEGETQDEVPVAEAKPLSE